MKEILYVKRIRKIESDSVEKGAETWYTLELSSGDGACKAMVRKIDPFDGLQKGQTVILTVQEPIDASPRVSEDAEPT